MLPAVCFGAASTCTRTASATKPFARASSANDCAEEMVGAWAGRYLKPGVLTAPTAFAQFSNTQKAVAVGIEFVKAFGPPFPFVTPDLAVVVGIHPLQLLRLGTALFVRGGWRWRVLGKDYADE